MKQWVPLCSNNDLMLYLVLVLNNNDYISFITFEIVVFTFKILSEYYIWDID